MSEWEKTRICKKCSKEFTLREHGHPGARAAADALERGKGYDSSANYMSVQLCSECAGKVIGESIAAEIMRQQRVREKWGWVSGFILEPGIWLTRITFLLAIAVAVWWWFFR